LILWTVSGKRKIFKILSTWLADIQSGTSNFIIQGVSR